MRRLLLVSVNVILFVAGLWAQAQDQQKFKVSGTVVNEISGEPVRGARVTVQGSDSHSTIAGNDGRFEIDDVSAGTVYVMADHAGFTPQFTPQSLVISSGTDSVVVKLRPFSKISGRIVDNEGEPIDNISVQCMHEMIVNGRKQWQPAGGGSTDETGQFLIENVAAGTYLLSTRQAPLYLAIRPQSEPARYIYPATFYPNAPNRESAQPIDVAPGADVKVDMTLHSIRAVRVTFVTVPASQFVMASVSDGEDQQMDENVAQPDPATGMLTLGAVAPGSCKLVARGPFNQGMQIISGRPAEQLYGEVPLEVGTSDITNIKVPLNKLPEIPVLTASGKSQVSVQLFSKAGNVYGATSATEGGEMKIYSIVPGSYRVVARDNGGGCIKAVTSGAQDLLREDLVVPSGGSVAPIQVTQSENCPSLTVSTNAKVQAMGIIVSDSKGFEPQMFPVSSTGFAVQGLSEGDYRVYAFSNVENLEYANPDAMRNFKSQAVKLEAGQKATIQVEVNERAR